ncbi:40S ribosomal protein S5-1 [Hordeum vulgare]|nr:40S ribosomal protein S5-1 [Hordeum vulgare]
MSEGMLHIRDVEGPKKTGSMEMRLEAMEHQVFKCQGMVERGPNANHTMITEFTSNHKMDAIDIGKHLSRLYDRVDQLRGQVYDLQNQNCEYEYRFKSIRRHQVGAPFSDEHSPNEAFTVLFSFVPWVDRAHINVASDTGHQDGLEDDEDDDDEEELEESDDEQ